MAIKVIGKNRIVSFRVLKNFELKSWTCGGLPGSTVVNISPSLQGCGFGPWLGSLVAKNPKHKKEAVL